MQSIDALKALRARAKADMLADLFPKQRAFVEDKARFKAALCTRRAGKTFGAGRYLATTALARPNVPTAYVTLTRFNAKRLMWPALHRMKAARGLAYELNESDLMARCSNGSSIWLFGADDARKVERLRGEGWGLVVIDEPGSFPQQLLGYLMHEVIEPALVDLRGTECLTGTPAPIPSGTFYDATTTDTIANGGRWSLHQWSMTDNPHILDVQSELERVLRDNHWTKDHPKFRREYLGEWVRDLGSLVYPYDRAKNWVDCLPEGGDWLYTLGIDYGTVDATAFAVWAWRRRVPHEVYLVESWGKTGLIPSDAAEEVKKLSARYRFDRIVGDVGGLGKGYAEEARRRWSLPIVPAQKTNKRGFIELMQGDMRAGNIKVVGPACAEWIDEAEKLQWEDDSRSTEHPGFANHRLDAALYGYREARAWNEKPKAPEPTQEEKIVRVAEQAWKKRQKPYYAR